MGFNLSMISRYRSELMGVATIGILMCHAHGYDVNLPFHLDSVFALGQVGVMIFFLLSGLGLYYSTRKLECGLYGLCYWYKKRYVRILIPYIVIYGPVHIVQMIDNDNFSWGGYLYELSTISYWINGGGCWFVCVLLPLYFLTPFWNSLLERIKYPIIPTLSIMTLMNISDFYDGAFCQAAFFFFGFWMARYVKTDVTINTKWILIIGFAFLVLLGSYYLFAFWGLLAILLIPAVWLLCIIFDIFKNTFINTIFRFLGKISLESYLFNVTLITWIDHFHLIPESLYAYRYAFVVVFGILLSWGINRLCKPIVQVLSK